MKRYRGITKPKGAAVQDAPRATYEGAISSPNRANINAPARHAYEDLTKRDRVKLLEITRELERNDGVLNGILDLLERYVIGANGISIIPDTSDADFNIRARAAWESWQPWCDVESRFSWGSRQRLASRLWAMDGDAFILLTEEWDEGSRRMRPRIQIVESHRCQTPPEKRALEGVTFFDGVEVDHIGRPVRYWFQTSEYKDGAGKSQHSRERIYRGVDASFVVHIFDPSRAQQHRGASLFYPVLNDLRDLREWHNLEMLATKDAAETGKIITNEAGEEEIDPQRALVYGTDAASEEGWTDEEMANFREVFGARSRYMKNGEKVEVLQHARPADSTQRFWDRIVDRICAGVGIPRELLFPSNLRGPLVHAVFDMANAYFRALTPMFVEHFQRVYWHVLSYEFPDSQRPADWRRYKYIPPKAINVNVGRNSAALINEWKSGWRTDEEIAAMDNRDWRDVTEQKAKEAAYKREMLAKYPGISMADLSQINPNEGRDPVEPEPEDPEKDEEEDEDNA